MIKLPYGWDSAVQAAKEANGNGSLNNMQIAASIILEMDSQLRSPAQTKTVADAVEWAKGKNASNLDWTHIRVCRRGGSLFFADGDTNSNRWDDSDLVCTRAEFEAYVKEQECEKWTHTWNGRKCRVVFTEDYTSWIKCEGLKDIIVKTDDLKPIKPTLTKAEAWDKLKNLPANEWSIHSHVMELENKYDII